MKYESTTSSSFVCLFVYMESCFAPRRRQNDFCSSNQQHPRRPLDFWVKRTQIYLRSSDWAALFNLSESKFFQVRLIDWQMLRGSLSFALYLIWVVCHYYYYDTWIQCVILSSLTMTKVDKIDDWITSKDERLFKCNRLGFVLRALSLSF